MVFLIAATSTGSSFVLFLVAIIVSYHLAVVRSIIDYIFQQWIQIVLRQPVNNTRTYRISKSK